MSTERAQGKWKEGISSSIKYTILESFKEITATNEISKILNDVMKKRTGYNEE
jgi:predicted PP-loop superfamily ATPase